MTHLIEEGLQFMKIKRKTWKDIMKVNLCMPKVESVILALEKRVKFCTTQNFFPWFLSWHKIWTWSRKWTPLHYCTIWTAAPSWNIPLRTSHQVHVPWLWFWRHQQAPRESRIYPGKLFKESSWKAGGAPEDLLMSETRCRTRRSQGQKAQRQSAGTFLKSANQIEHN